MHIFWARLGSFGHLGLISNPLIVSKFNNETHDPKGGENKIYTIVKGLALKGVFFYFCAYSSESLATKCVFSFFALILNKTLPQRVFALNCLNPNNPAEKGVFRYYCSYSKQSPTKKGVSSIIALILTKALSQRVFNVIFAIILTKAMPQRVFFLYFCHNYNQSLTKKDVVSLNLL